MSPSARDRVVTSSKRRGVALRRTGAVLLVVLTLGVGAVAAWWYLVRDDRTAGTSSVACPGPDAPPAPSTAGPAESSPPSGAPGPTDRAAPRAPVFLPATPLPPERVTVTVYNATDRDGLAAAVTEQLVRRGFTVGEPANDPLEKDIAAPAEVRFGRAGAASALSVAAQLAGAVPVLDDRRGRNVSLVLGDGFRDLRAPADALAAATPVAAPTATLPTTC